MKTLYFGGPIITMEPGDSPEAVLVENGRILKTGSRAELGRESGPELYDLRGKTLMPAFLDPHSHLTAAAQTFGMKDLSRTVSFDEIVSALQEQKKLAAPAPGEWIIGFGYDQNALKEKNHPDRKVLDRISRENPVLISHASGHMGVLNTRGLEAMGITADTPDPEGGRLGREKDGTPNGFLEEAAFTGRSGEIPRPALEQQFRQLARAEDLYFSHGIVTIQDGMTKEPEWALLSAAAEQKKLRADVVCYADLEHMAGFPGQHPDYRGKYRNRLKIGGYKIFLDGSPQGRTAWMSRPYCGDDPDYCGYPVHSDEKVLGFVKTALKEKEQLLTHCNGDAAADQLISCFEKASAELEQKAVRPVMIHAQLARKDQLPRMQKLGMFASFFTAHSWYWGDVHLKNFGRERAEHISPAASAKASGVAFTFHQDTPVIPPDMIETVWCAVNRQTKNGVSLDGGEKISVWDALRAVTLTAAEQYGEEKEKGSIREGKRADFVILSENPLEIPPEELKRIKVCETIRAGETLYRLES